MGIDYQRDPEALKLALREHSIHGYPLKVPFFDKALGVKTNSIRELTSVVVALETPELFDDFANDRDWPSDPHPIKYWIDYARQHNFPHADREPLRWLHPKSRILLEEGYQQSLKDIKRAWLEASGLVQKEFLTGYNFNLSEVGMSPKDIQPGMLVEFLDELSDKRKTGIPGRVVGVGEDPQDDSKIIYLETFEPMPALLAPKAMAPWLIEPSFVPDRTWVLGYGTLDAMRRKKIEIPKGMFDPNDSEQRVYFLDQPVPLSFVEQFCKENYPKHPECVWQSVVLTVVPLHPAADSKGRHRGGAFRPYPDDLLTTEIEAQIDYFGEGMEFEE